MPNFCKKISETAIRLGEVRFSYANVFAPRRNEDGTPGKYSVQVLVPKANKQAEKLVNDAVAAAAQNGSSTKWNGKKPRLQPMLRDGDEEHPDDDTYKGMWFFNCSTQSKPGVLVLENGDKREALDSDDFYSGCWGAVTLNFYPYAVSGNMGVAAGLNNVIKTKDDTRLGGGRSAMADFGDLDDLLD